MIIMPSLSQIFTQVIILPSVFLKCIWLNVDGYDILHQVPPPTVYFNQSFIHEGNLGLYPAPKKKGRAPSSRAGNYISAAIGLVKNEAHAINITHDTAPMISSSAAAGCNSNLIKSRTDMHNCTHARSIFVKLPRHVKMGKMVPIPPWTVMSAEEYCSFSSVTGSSSAADNIQPINAGNTLGNLNSTKSNSFMLNMVIYMLGEGVNNIYSFLDGFNIEKNFIKN
jgi:hypothetical protein